MTEMQKDDLILMLMEALRMARPYVRGAYECAFPDEMENESVLKSVDSALALADAARVVNGR